jgi:hypothetical protein
LLRSLISRNDGFFDQAKSGEKQPDSSSFYYTLSKEDYFMKQIKKRAANQQPFGLNLNNEV